MSQFSQDITAIDRWLRNHRRAYMEPLGLKGIHARMFMLICRTPGCSQDQITRQMGFDKSTIARQVELLESIGYVERKPSEKDKRVLCVYPTGQMLDFQQELKSAMDRWENELLQGLTETEKQQLSVIMEKLRKTTEKEAG